jgi:hypothetical protein
VALPPDFIGPRGRDRVLPDYALIGTAQFRDAALTPIQTLPMIHGAAGEIVFGSAAMTLNAASGTVAVDGRGELQAAGTAFAIPELGGPSPQGDLHLKLTGPASALAEISDTPPLSVAADRGIDPGALSGNADLALDVSIPLTGDIEKLSPAFRLALDDFASTAPIEGRTIADADLVLEGSPETFTVKGEGMLDGLQASVDLILGTGAPAQTDVKLTLDDAAREHLGLGLDWLVQGPVEAALKADGDGQRIALDLKAARITLPFLGWEKGPGVPATASFRMQRSDAGTELTDITVSGSGFSAKGSLLVGPEGGLQRLALSEVALHPGDRLAADIVANGGGFDANVKGSAFDARGLIGVVTSGVGSSTSEVGPVRVTMDIDAVTGQNGVVLSNVAGSLTVTGKGLDAASLKGGASGAGQFESTSRREGDTRVLRVFAEDAGSLPGFADLYTKVVGGNLILDYSGPVGGVGSGVVLLRDFRLRNETALAPAIETATQASRDEMMRSQTVSGDTSFTQLRIPFSQKDWVITIQDAALRGPMLGATADGTVNVPDGKMAISGTFIPAFGINNVVGAIPLVGTILGGGRDEGLVGITFRLFGPIRSPEMAMNPLSAIAPGIFRKIFEYR